MLQRASLRLKVVIRHINAARMSSQAAEEDVLFQQVNNTGMIMLNRPKALNALNLSMVRKIMTAMQKWETDPNIALVVIKGAGEKSFCAGGDIRAVTEAGKVGDPLARDFFKEEYILNHKIGTYKKPYVALINGITMGGGVGLSVHGRFRVASEKSLFAMPETAIGLFPDVGGGHFLPRLHGNLGVYLALTGFRLKGRNLAKVGVATHFVENQFIPELETELTRPLPKASVSDVQNILESIQIKSVMDVDKEFILSSRLDKINELFGGASMEEIFLALEKDGSDWAKSQLETLQKMSPVSMKITLRLLREGKSRSLADDLNVEYRLCQRCVEDKDFYEGVRAVLVDRDNSPKWSPASIQEVTPAKVDWYFSPLESNRELII